MDSTTNINSGDEFIELDRTFHEIPASESDSDDLETISAYHFGDRLHWRNLIDEYRVILLSAAGSGKTEEIRNIARVLREERGLPAFFLRLELMPRDFEIAFEEGTYEAFGEWLASAEEGWLFLDSVDEARLRDPRDFELAIRQLEGRISTARDRTHIVITGRTSAWRPKTDLDLCTDLLRCGTATTSKPVSPDEDVGPDGSVKTETGAPDKKESIFKIVALDNLTPDQVAVFARARGIENSTAFLDAVERADAQLFTARPQDLEELIEFWKDEGQIGTRLELMRNSVDRRLAERDQDRADARPLSPECARQGARLLAAAATLVQTPSIRVPDGAENTKGIAVQSVLPDWDDKEQATLLLRPIFDEAIYGAVRFHHRSAREYLTAEWFAELLKRETSCRAIETLFFRKQYGLDIITPTLRPILPWLAIIDEKIRDRLREVAPEIIFEGGDPSQLPLEVRRSILCKVCEQMADDATGRPMRAYAAVQRFANPDLTDDVRELIRQYADNDDLTAFLLRMVWLGQLSDALPEAMEVALTPNAERYTRIAAFRAVRAIGSEADCEHVRQSFLEEAPGLKRAWLAELVERVQPTTQTLAWLLACLEKSETKKRYTADHLTRTVTEFAGTAHMDLLPAFVAGLAGLLSLPPVINRQHCGVSERFEWLIAPASKAVERMVSARDPASLEPAPLSILHKVSAVRDYRNHDLGDIKADFTKLVPAWKELNRALFWFGVSETRKAMDRKRDRRLISCWHDPLFGSFVRFEEGDFEYVAGEIFRQAFLDNRLLALSLAFHLYASADRPRAWREKLKKLVADNDELSDRLRTYLNPPAQSQDERRWKQEHARLNRQRKAEEKRREECHTEWREYLKRNIEKVRAELRDNPGKITNDLYYLFEQTCDEENIAQRWTEYNWRKLIPEYGEDVARFYRDGTVSFWRQHVPKLRSEGAPLNETPNTVIIGLTGIEIEAHETKDWAANLNPADVELACKYASFELNGFPTWLPRLFAAHPKIVGGFLVQEMRFELSVAKPEKDISYVLSDVSWSGQWAWDEIAPSICDLLKKEPKNLNNLDQLLKILQGSAISRDRIEKLATRKCRTLRKPEHVARWYAVWTGVAPDAAIASLKDRFGGIGESDERTSFAMTFATSLLGGRNGDASAVRQAFKTPEYLKSLYLLMHEHIRYEEDIDRVGTGVYSPELRDQAQRARDGLFNLLDEIPGKEAFLALTDIAKLHPENASKPWILDRARRKAEQDGDLEPWSPEQVRDFHDELDRTPSNHRELAELAEMRFLDLKDEIEHGDSSIADLLRMVTQETDMRKYLGRELREKAHGRYSISQEEELADAKRPDLRFHGVGFDGPVPVELKLADNWAGPKLLERLKNQLCGDYLRDNCSDSGIFVLVYRGAKQHWDVADRVDFAGLIVAIETHWQRISPEFPNVEHIEVIGIDLTKRSG